MNLIDLLNIENRQQYFAELEKYGVTDGDFETLANALNTQTDMITAKNVAIALGYIKSSNSIQLLAKLIQHEHIFVREKAGIALGLIGLEACVPILVEAFKRENIKHWDVRMAMIEALGEIASPLAYHALIDMFADEDISLWSDIEDALYQHRAETIPIMLERVHDENIQIKMWVIHALGRRENAIAFDVLKPYCYHDNIEIQEYAIRAIGRIKHPDVLQFLQQFLQHPNEIIRMAGKSAIDAYVKYTDPN